MAKDFAKSFYNSKMWIDVSRLYMERQHYICERCGSVASICHHKTWLNPKNIGDINIALSEDNLECLCQDCHNKEHMRKSGACVFDEHGQVVGMIDKRLDEYADALKAIDAILTA